MQQKRIILLVIFGALLALFGIITMQYLLVLVVLAGVVLILMAMDVKKWVEGLVDKIAAGNRSGSSDTSDIRESIQSIRAETASIRERLDLLEAKKKRSCDTIPPRIPPRT
jgi:hypothetical protein|nr:hypothetical protein [uncultured Methanoregula sp.]